MKRFRLLLVFIVLLPATAARADLAGDIQAVLRDKLFSKNQVGIEIIRLGAAPGQARTIYELRGTTPRIPASNLKLITTAAAVEKLGADFQFKTTLATRGGDVALIGDGDPSLGDAAMLKKVGWGVDTVFKTWAGLLKSRGVTTVENVYVDDSIFDMVFVHPNWPEDQQHKWYEAQVGGLNLNVNCVDFYLQITGRGSLVTYWTDPPTKYITVRNACVTGNSNAIWLARQLGTNDLVLRGETNASNTEAVSVTIHDPSMYAATVLAETFAANGVRVTGQVIRDREIRGAMMSKNPATQPSRQWMPLAVHATPMSVILSRANKDSINLYAESLCKRVGAADSGMSGSWENGAAAVGGFLQSLGVAKDEYSLDDGCGLSKSNTISPNAVARVLEHEFHSRDREAYMNSLAVGGIDGTLKDRFDNSDLRGRVFGKSGYVAGVRSLSGYLKARDGQWYAFSILMNGLPEGADGGTKRLQEKIVEAIDAASGGRVAAGE